MKKNLLLALAATCLLIAYSGCNPGDPGTDHPPKTNDSLNADEDMYGDWIRIYIGSDPDALHPYASTHGSATMIKEVVFQYLYDFDPQTKLMVPVLVKDYAKVSEDGLAFTFEMRDEAVWDDGTPVTGYDYAFSVKCMLNPISESPHIRNYYSFIKEVQVDPNNSRRFTVITEEPFFLSEYSVAGFEIISHDFYDPDHFLDKVTIPQIRNDENIKNDPNLIAFNKLFHQEKFKREPEGVKGSGPYRFTSWVTGDNVTLERKKDWWGYKTGIKGWPFEAYADRLIYKTISDKTSAVAAARAGEIDVMRDVPTEEFTKFRNDPDNPVSKMFKLHTPDSYTYVYIGMNGCPPAGREKLLVDKRVRRAMALLTDVDRIIETVYDGFGTRIVGPISPHNVTEYNDKLTPVPFDPEKAKALLDEAGWTDSDGDGVRDKMIRGKKVPLDIDFYISSSSSTAPRMAGILAADAKKAGVNINVVRKEFTKMTDDLKSHDFDMFGAAFNGNPLPKDLRQVWHTESWVSRGSNYTCFGNPKSDSLIQEIRVTMSPEERKPLYFEVQEMIADEQPMIFIMAPQDRVIIHNRFKNAETTTVRPGFKVQQFKTPKADQKRGDS